MEDFAILLEWIGSIEVCSDLFESLEILEAFVRERKKERKIVGIVYRINVSRRSVFLGIIRWKVFRILLVEYFVTILFFVEKGS